MPTAAQLDSGLPSRPRPAPPHLTSPPPRGARCTAALRAGMERGAQPGVGVRRLRNVAREEPFAAVLGALRGCYAEATPLEAFVRRLQEGGTGEVEVLRGDDAQCYRTFVSQCVVCVPRGARAIPRPICFQQVGRRESGRAVPARARPAHGVGPGGRAGGCGALPALRAFLRAPLPSWPPLRPRPGPDHPRSRP